MPPYQPPFLHFGAAILRFLRLRLPPAHFAAFIFFFLRGLLSRHYFRRCCRCFHFLSRRHFDFPSRFFQSACFAAAAAEAATAAVYRHCAADAILHYCLPDVFAVAMLSSRLRYYGIATPFS